MVGIFLFIREIDSINSGLGYSSKLALVWAIKSYVILGEFLQENFVLKMPINL